MAILALQKVQAREIPADAELASFIDVETTGLSPAYAEIVELAIVLFAFRPGTGEIVGVVDEYTGLREPRGPIPRDAIAVHGIHDSDVKGKLLDDRQVRSLMFQSRFLMAHNASFDRGFVSRLYPECLNLPWLCSMNAVPWRRLGFHSKGLQNLLRDHRIQVERAHRGADDVYAALRLLASTDRDGHYYFKYILDRFEGQKRAERASGSF